MISILCPTRNRLQMLKRMINSAIKKSSEEIEVLLYIDDDDDTDYSDLGHVIKIVGKPKGMGEIFNELAAKAKGDLLLMGNDDMLFRSNGWDKTLRERVSIYPDNIFVAWFDDGSGSKKAKCVFPIVSREWIDCIGSLVPEFFNFLYHDTWLYDIAQKIDRRIYIKEVLLEHLHFAFGKSAYDSTYDGHHKNKKAIFTRNAKPDRMTFADTNDIRHTHADYLRKAIMDYAN